MKQEQVGRIVKRKVNIETIKGIEEREMDVQDIPLSEIEGQSTNYRLDVNKEGLSTLMASIEEHGLLQPIGLMSNGAGYDIVYGNRRYWAYKKLGKFSIPAVIFDIKDDLTFLLIHGAENCVRKDLSAMELGRYYADLAKQGLTNKEISIRVGQTIHHVESCLGVTRSIPKEYADKVYIERPGRGKRKKGRINLSISKLVSNAVKSGKISTAQSKKIYDMALDNHKYVTDNFKEIVHAVSNNQVVDLASSDNLEAFSTKIVMSKKHFKSLSAKFVETGECKNIHDLLRKILTGEIKQRIILKN